MSLTEGLKGAISLLSRRDRRRLSLVILLQAGTALMDLAGVMALGVVAALASSAATGEPLAFGGSLLSFLPLPVDVTTRDVVIVAIFAGVLLISKSLIGLYLTRRSFRFLASRQAEIAGGLAARLLQRPLLEVNARSSQETMYALTNGVSAVMLGLVGQALIVVSEMLLLIAVLGGLLVIDPVVTLFTAVFFGIVAVVLQRLLGAWARRLGEAQAAIDVESDAAVQQSIRAYREVSTMGRRRLFIDRFQDLRWRSARITADTYVVYQISKYVYEISLVVGGALLITGVAATRDLVAAIAIVVVFLAAASRVFPSLLRMQSALVNMGNSLGQAVPTFDLIGDLDAAEARQPSESVNDKDAEAIVAQIAAGYREFDGQIRVDTVSITYPETDVPALDNVTLSVNTGTSIALVGSTGSGKSTFADILLGVLEPDHGTVSIGGLSPREVIARWPGVLAYVPQDVIVLSGTVRDNVALGISAEVVDDRLVWDALERAHLAAFLRDSREGLDTIVGEHGVKLSGGQRQRLGIARALFTRPRLIVLDEATSALDAETEQEITSTLDSLVGDVTMVVIAHRLATVRKCDVVAYLDQGKLRALGQFDAVRTLVPDFDKQASLLGL